MSDFTNESLIDMYIFETTENIEQIERTILSSEESETYSSEAINEIFRHMHTIKGSSAVMELQHISSLAHSIEDLFFFIRENEGAGVKPADVNDLVLSGIDFIKVELEKIKNGVEADGDAEQLTSQIRSFIETLKQSKSPVDINNEMTFRTEEKSTFPKKDDDAFKDSLKNIFKATVFFKEGCEMENIRAYGLIKQLQEFTNDLYYLPKNILEDSDTAKIIREKGFMVYLKTDKSYDDLHALISRILFLERLQLTELEDETEIHEHFSGLKEKCIKSPDKDSHHQQGQAMISVSMSRLDKLMDLVGEIVIAEAMVTQNPQVKRLGLESFDKAAGHLHKIISELQDLVMSIRMVPIANTFHIMHRVIRDMSRKLGKEIKLQIIGEDTKVDKNIVEHITDPLLHLVRNAVDHGIEEASERLAKNKSGTGSITLEAKNAGNDVWIMVKDDGRGLHKEKIMMKAMEKGILAKPPEEMTDQEIYQLIFSPGFSTNSQISEYSGRGVGLDVVVKKIEAIGGSVMVDSEEDKGTTVTLKIPLTLAIVEGMNILVGNNRYTIPIAAIQESFKAEEHELICDPGGNEMILVRGKLYPIIRLHECFSAKTDITDIRDGILLMVEQDQKAACLFADQLLGQQDVVVKPLPVYIKNLVNVRGLSGCTLLGDGSISLILNITGLIEMSQIRASFLPNIQQPHAVTS